MRILMPSLVAIVTAVCGIPSADATEAPARYPARGVVKLSPTPLNLLVHYVNGSQQPVESELRQFDYAPPDLSLSSALKAIAAQPCSVGDQVQVHGSKFAGKARGIDALGIGRFVWILDGRYVSDGTTWRFTGKIAPAPDLYDFNSEKPGTREFSQEVLTRIGAQIPGKTFRIEITGFHDVEIRGACSLTAAGTAIA